MHIGQALDLVSRYDSLRNPLTSLGDYLDPELISRCLAEAGTVTSVVSRPFGQLAADPESNHIELRASWTPTFSTAEDVDSHLGSWSDLCLLSCGVSPIHDDIAAISPRRAEFA